MCVILRNRMCLIFAQKGVWIFVLALIQLVKQKSLEVFYKEQI